MFDSISAKGLNSILSNRTPRSLNESDIDQLYMICAARVTKQNWNEPGYTFILVTDEDANWLSIDNLSLDDFISGITTTVELYPKYMELILKNQDFVNIEILDQDEENEEEFVNEGVFVADDEILALLDKSVVKSVILESIAMSHLQSDPFRMELASFISASLKQ